MQLEHETRRRPVGSASRIKELLVRAAALVVGAALLVGAFVLSIVFFAVALAVMVVVGGVVWWKTRHLRRQMRARSAPAGSGRGEVIEGSAEDITGR